MTDIHIQLLHSTNEWNTKFSSSTTQEKEKCIKPKKCWILNTNTLYNDTILMLFWNWPKFFRGNSTQQFRVILLIIPEKKGKGLKEFLPFPLLTQRTKHQYKILWERRPCWFWFVHMYEHRWEGTSPRRDLYLKKKTVLASAQYRLQ